MTSLILLDAAQYDRGESLDDNNDNCESVTRGAHGRFKCQIMSERSGLVTL